MALAVITGASSGIGYQLARRAVEDGHALIAVAHDAALMQAADQLRRLGGTVETVRTDLATEEGVAALLAQLEGREVDLLFANAGIALEGALHEQAWEDIARLIALNVRQTTRLVHEVARGMAARGRGRILITGSIAGYTPGPFDAVYNASKSYLDSFAMGLRDELKETGVVVTALMPGPVDTAIFDKAGMGDAPISNEVLTKKPAAVARAGYEALMRGEAKTVPGAPSRIVTALSGVVPESLIAEIHRHIARG
ncbi:SDR family NAD(P)-dependent oxidoreductase [Roseitranquillus sediminis]|uniref:SDR family NAD(P)-dependent oxidoreductase n=1 Tax=Roseitranquillus sediminis TaxID=2809051 RepID=UPI001D0C9A2E|nr:SDR family NAD(P)-dependent oxidoreductase [Roseitranquillus sediminis]MBM9593609.1 SDR family NAD(P)-dependent oxidoreductase [Roseitranquillus sediminis]